MSKNITFNVEGFLIDKARTLARNEGKTLNHLFREWIFRYVKTRKKGVYGILMKKLKYACSGSKFTKDEMNER